MAYTVPHTWVAGDFLRASWLNIHSQNEIDHESRIVTLETDLAAAEADIAALEAIGANVVGQSASVDNEIALFSGTGGKTIKRATTTGLLKATSGVIAAAVAGTDYLAPASGVATTVSTLRLGGATGPILTRTRTVLTDAQVKALPTTAITIAAAPGAGRVLSPILYTLITDFSAAAYTNITDGGYVFIGFDGSDTSGRLRSAYIPDDSGASLTKLTELLSAIDGVFHLEPYMDFNSGWGNLVFGGAQSFVVNKPLQIKASNSGDFTGGNGSNTLVVEALYLDVSIT